MTSSSSLFQSSLKLPCGAILKNRLAKSAMSDSLGDGEGNPTEAQINLYKKWAKGGAAISFIGEVQGDPRYPEAPGNLLLHDNSNYSSLQLLTQQSTIDNSHLWAQIGHGGALSYLPISHPKGPSALDLKNLKCEAMSKADIQALPSLYAKTALYAKKAGFSGVHIHAGHGFLLSQFLSPLFNKRTDQYGGSIQNRSQIILDIINEVRAKVGKDFPIGIRINATDQLEGGLTEQESLSVIAQLNDTSLDLIDISGGTYFPGAKSSSENTVKGAYFFNFAKQAKQITNIPLMLTGGIKTKEEALSILSSGAADLIGLARVMALEPSLPNYWLSGVDMNPEFPLFDSRPAGGITAWYTMRLKALSENKEDTFNMNLESAIRLYEERDKIRTLKWKKHFGLNS
ncbi:MAG: oxidoreductase [Marinomonas sp.]